MAAPAAASGFASGQPEERQLLVSFLLHCADLGNPLRPPSLSARIADDLQREFEAQAARERAQGLPVTVRGPCVVVIDACVLTCCLFCLCR